MTTHKQKIQTEAPLAVWPASPSGWTLRAERASNAAHGDTRKHDARQPAAIIAAGLALLRAYWPSAVLGRQGRSLTPRELGTMYR